MNQAIHNGLPEADGRTDGFRGAGDNPLWPGVLFIAIVTILAYSSVFTAGFIWDDNDHVIKLLDFSGIDGLKRIWFEPGATIQYYPLVFTAFWAQIQLWGVDPLGFHLVNILLHGVNALLVWRCLERLAIPGAFWAACIFAVHPLHVESVAWVTELKNVLSALFYQLSLLSFWRFSNPDTGARVQGSKGVLWYAGSLALFGCALLSKTVTCTLPAVILLLAWWKRGRIGKRDVVLQLPFLLLAVVLGVLTLRVEADYLLAKGPEWGFSITERLLLAGRITWFHIGKLLWPHPLIFNYPRWRLDATSWWQYIFPLTVCAVLYLLWRYRERIGRGPLAACLFVIGTNFPVLGFLNVYSFRFSFVADHYYYLANAGVIALFCVAMSGLKERLPHGSRQFVTVSLIAVITAMAVTTWQQGWVYRDNLTLFNDILEKNPASWFSYSNRAVHYLQAGQEELALADLNSSLSIKPDEADALHTRGVIYLKRKRFEEAFADFDRSIAIRPWRTDYLLNRCLAYRHVGRLDEALSDADTIVSKTPGDLGSLLLRASIQALRGDYRHALEDLNAAQQLDPEEFQVYANRGLVYFRLGMPEAAIRDYDIALRLMPDSAETYFNRGLAHAAAGSVAQVRSDLSRARELGYELTAEEFERILSEAVKKQL